ncbi:hypothetical protein [Nonomuraea dietziae]|uniref:hypothetical protein n=1 Tax=Nonomuraea dietziae TaxID=65515 RepID=UPI0031D0E798
MPYLGRSSMAPATASVSIVVAGGAAQCIWSRPSSSTDSHGLSAHTEGSGSAVQLPDPWRLSR